MEEHISAKRHKITDEEVHEGTGGRGQCLAEEDQVGSMGSGNVNTPTKDEQGRLIVDSTSYPSVTASCDDPSWPSS